MATSPAGAWGEQQVTTAAQSAQRASRRKLFVPGREELEAHAAAAGRREVDAIRAPGAHARGKGVVGVLEAVHNPADPAGRQRPAGRPCRWLGRERVETEVAVHGVRSAAHADEVALALVGPEGESGITRLVGALAGDRLQLPAHRAEDVDHRVEIPRGGDSDGDPALGAGRHRVPDRAPHRAAVRSELLLGFLERGLFRGAAHTGRQSERRGVGAVVVGGRRRQGNRRQDERYEQRAESAGDLDAQSKPGRLTGVAAGQPRSGGSIVP